MTDAEKIAASLSEGAKAWLGNPGYADPNTIRALRRRGIIDGLRLTPFGLSVRAIIQGETA